MTGNQSLLKRINRTALVRLIKAEPGLSRVELAHRTGLTKAAVGVLVQELIEEGWLSQSEPSAGAGVGRRRVPLSLDGRHLALLGAEVGVDYLDAVACDLQGQLLWSRRLPYRAGDVGRTVRRLAALLGAGHRALRGQRRRAMGLGVGVPGAVDARDGTVRFAPNLGWHDVDLVSPLRRALRAEGCGDLSLQLLNEANAAALSEYVFGGAPPAGPLVYLSMGIGLGAGVVLRDQLYLGQDGLAGELGHTIVERGGPACACGRRGCAEAFVSQRAVSRAVTGRSEPILPIEELARRVARREPRAVRGATQAGEYLGILLQNIGNAFDPAAIVLGGPLCQLGDLFVRRALRSMAAHAGRHDDRHPVVRLGRFGIDACAVGAAASVFQDYLTGAGAQGPGARRGAGPQRPRARRGGPRATSSSP